MLDSIRGASHNNNSALESSHAIWEGVRLAKTLPKDQDIVIVSVCSPCVVKKMLRLVQCLSGRGDKDVEQISQLLPKWADTLDWHVAPHAV